MYVDINGLVRCKHNNLVHIAGPDAPCNNCEYEEYFLAREFDEHVKENN
jgi:hypothetical protein